MEAGAHTPPEPEAVKPPSQAAEISTAVVRLMREYTGRGPTKARTTLNYDLAVVVLRDTLLKGERRLAADGHSEDVLKMRRRFQQSMRMDLIAEVERITGRRVVAFMSDNHIEPDVAAELFIFENGQTGDPVGE